MSAAFAPVLTRVPPLVLLPWSCLQVDGPLSVYCYLNTMDLLLARYAAKFEKRMGRAFCLDSDAGGC